MAGKVLGCDRATRTELLKQWTLAQSKKYFYNNLAEVLDMYVPEEEFTMFKSLSRSNYWMLLYFPAMKVTQSTVL